MIHKVVVVTLGLSVALLLNYVWWKPSSSDLLDIILDGIDVPDVTLQFSKEYEGPPEIIQITSNVYVAFGYAFASVTMLVGDDSVVIVDTTDGVETAGQIAQEFRKITNKPIKDIIYTHYHADHTMGAVGFVQDGTPPPEVWAHINMAAEEADQQITRMAAIHRGAYQWGLHIPTHYRVKAFSGADSIKEIMIGDRKPGKLKPTKYIHGDTNVTIAGLELQLLHVPGETSDHIAIWYPETGVLIAADDLYRSFPNLYAIRGSLPRNTSDWISSVDRLQKLNPRCLLTGHSKPVCGEETVHKIMSDYKAAIQFVHDQTVRFINKGVHPDEIAKLVKLPQEFADQPFVQEVHGTVYWSVKGIYNFYMGWFSGDAVDLNVLTLTEKSERMLKLVGEQQLLKASETALKAGDYQWSLELSSYVYKQDPHNTEALLLRRMALRGLAGLQTSLNGRHYLMSVIMEDADLIPRRSIKRYLLNAPVEAILRATRFRLKAEELPIKENIKGCFYFSDTNSTMCLHIHDRIIDVYEDDQNTDSDQWTFKVTTTEEVLKEIVSEVRSPVKAYINRDITVEGGVSNLRKFLSYLDV